MNIKSYGVICIIRTHRPSKKHDNKTPIYLRITINGERVELVLPKFVEPDKWDSKRGLQKVGKNQYSELNDYITSTRNKIIKYIEEQRLRNKLVTSQMVKVWYTKGDKNYGRFVIELFEDHNLRIKERLQNDYTESTYKRYSTTLSHLKSFINNQHEVDDLPIENVDYEFIQNFEHFLKTEQNLSHNTTMRYLRHFAKITNNAYENEWINRDPFKKFKIKFERVDQMYLTPEELLKIQEKQFNIQRLELVKDTFLFSCYTALSYIDTAKLTKEHLVTDKNRNWIQKSRKNQTLNPGFLFFRRFKTSLTNMQTTQGLMVRTKLFQF